MLSYKNYDFYVDNASNVRIYGFLESDVNRLKNDETINHYLFNRTRFLSNEIIDFLYLSGVDIEKENELFHYKIADNQIIIEGWYEIVGNILESEKLSFFWETDSSVTNIYFRNGIKNAARKEFEKFRTFRLEFSIVIFNSV